MGESSSNTVAFTAGWHGPARLPGRPRRKPLSPCLEALPRHAAASLSEDPGAELASPDVRAVPTARACPSPGSRSPPQHGGIAVVALAARALFEETLPHC